MKSNSKHPTKNTNGSDVEEDILYLMGALHTLVELMQKWSREKELMKADITELKFKLEGICRKLNA